MKLGIGLPESLPYGLDRTLLLDWARLADSAGFHTIAVRDRPNYDMWDPLLTLSAVAAVTERARLATTVLQLPIRNAVMVAKQAAVIDRLSDGRFDLGIGLGSRQDDYAVYGATMEHRITRYRHQVAEIRALWKTAHQTTTREFGPVGPAPVQEPGRPSGWGRCPRMRPVCDERSNLVTAMCLALQLSPKRWHRLSARFGSGPRKRASTGSRSTESPRWM